MFSYLKSPVLLPLGALLMAAAVLPACSKKSDKVSVGDPIGIRVEWSGTPFQLALATSPSVDPDDYKGPFSALFVEAAKVCPQMTTLAADMTAHLEGRVDKDKVAINGGEDPLLKCIGGTLNGKELKANKGKDFDFVVEIRAVKK
jgi:hypothetical protein